MYRRFSVYVQEGARCTLLCCTVERCCRISLLIISCVVSFLFHFSWQLNSLALVSLRGWIYVTFVVVRCFPRCSITCTGRATVHMIPLDRAFFSYVLSVSAMALPCSIPLWSNIKRTCIRCRYVMPCYRWHANGPIGYTRVSQRIETKARPRGAMQRREYGLCTGSCL
ncbi:hypothetical protein F5I97DRAFT_691945 [Phlebopus sp. FC_14]|nr:hypothetical protein F5I97DRAFT_691945 [Phlebopus sp. FC_14]